MWWNCSHIKLYGFYCSWENISPNLQCHLSSKALGKQECSLTDVIYRSIWWGSHQTANTHNTTHPHHNKNNNKREIFTMWRTVMLGNRQPAPQKIARQNWICVSASNIPPSCQLNKTASEENQKAPYGSKIWNGLKKMQDHRIGKTVLTLNAKNCCGHSYTTVLCDRCFFIICVFDLETIEFGDFKCRWQHKTRIHKCVRYFYETTEKVQNKHTVCHWSFLLTNVCETHWIIARIAHLPPYPTGKTDKQKGKFTR